MCFLVKYALFVANLVFTLAGLALIGLGTAVVLQSRELKDVMPVAIEAIPISVIVLGALVFVIAFFGCCGSIKENRCMLLVYTLCMLLLAGGKIYLSVVIFNSVSRMEDIVLDWIGQAFHKNDLREAFHAMEAAFKCCGTTGPDSYTQGVLPNLPPTCCPESIDTCDFRHAYDGCNWIVADFLEGYGTAIGGVMVALIVVELMAAVCGVALCSWVGNKKRSTV